MTAQIFHYQHRVSYAECTMGNHVYYGRYLEYLEAARGALFRSLGKTCLEWQAEEVLFPVVECHLRYRAPARYDDFLKIGLWIQELSRIRLTFAYRIQHDSGADLVDGITRHVCTDLHDKPRRVPGELALALRPFLTPQPAGP